MSTDRRRFTCAGCGCKVNAPVTNGVATLPDPWTGEMIVDKQGNHVLEVLCGACTEEKWEGYEPE